MGHRPGRLCRVQSDPRGRGFGSSSDAAAAGGGCTAAAPTRSSREFVSRVRKLSGTAEAVFYSHDGPKSFVRYEAETRTAELELGSIEDLCEGNDPFESAGGEWIDRYLPLLMAVESGISIHATEPDLKDKHVITILERLIMKPDVDLNNQLARDIQDRIKLTLATNTYSRKELIGALKKVHRSVRRHHAIGGPRGYVDFIKGRV